jgi:hypothetical protein
MAGVIIFTKNNLKILLKPPNRVFTFFHRRLLPLHAMGADHTGRIDAGVD